MIIKPGDIFYSSTHPWVITPHKEKITVVWNDGENIHYLKESQPLRVLQTTIMRFIEATK